MIHQTAMLAVIDFNDPVIIEMLRHRGFVRLNQGEVRAKYVPCRIFETCDGSMGAVAIDCNEHIRCKKLVEVNK